MTRLAPEDLLDDAGRLEAQDPEQMLRAVASGAAQVREAATFSAEAGVASLADDGRPRAVVVCGMGGSGIAGDVLAAVAGLSTPVPIVVHRGFGLPAWVGPVDLVIAVSSSGTTAETLSALEEAVRRGCRLLVVGAAGSPLEDLGRRGRGVVVPVTQGRQPRASVWALSTPLVVAGDALGLLEAPAPVVEQAALLLEDVAARCRVDADHLVNPAKRLALELSGQLPVLWGTSPLSGVAAPAPRGRPPRASVWALSTPLVVAGDALGLLEAPAPVVEQAALLLEDVAARCRVDADHLVNPAKRLALELSGQLPVLWGTSPLSGVAAYRFACQLNENAHTPAAWGALPEAGHNQIVSLDGAWAGVAPAGGGSAGGAPADPDDFFRDRGDDEDGERAVRLHLVLLRDSQEHPEVALRADVAQALAHERGVGVSALQAEGGSSFERFVSLVGLTDYASVYLALLEGTDPTPIDAITALKQRTTRG